MNHDNWKSLLSHNTRPSRSVLSVYLNVDQSKAVNLNRGFEREFKGLMASLRRTIHDKLELRRFHEAERHLADFLKVYETGARTVAMFFDETDGFFWHQALEIPMQDLARWDRDFFLKPLAAASDDFERYGVVLVDRAHARLFTVFLGEIEETEQKRFNPMKVRHLKTVGSDNWGSKNVVQRKADEQIRSNLRQVVGELDLLVKSRRVDRLLLAGPADVTSELRNLLPKRLALRVIGDLNIDRDAPSKDVLEATLRLAELYERESEQQLVKEVTRTAATTKQAVVGLSHTLKKVNEARIWQILFSEDFHSTGFECPRCAALFSISRASCAYCGNAIAPVDDVVEKAVERALRQEARIEIVRGEAAAALDNWGGIAAFLRTRTKAIRV